MVTTKTRKTPREQALYAQRAPALNGKKKKKKKKKNHIPRQTTVCLGRPRYRRKGPTIVDLN